MASRTVIIPNDIQPTNPISGDPMGPALSFGGFVTLLTMDAQFTKDASTLFQAWDLRLGLRKGPDGVPLAPGDLWKIGESEYKKLCDVLNNPTNPHQPSFIEMVPFFRAILDAGKVE